MLFRSWVSWKATRPDWVKQGLIVPLVQIGLKKEEDLPQVPLLTELAENAEQRAIFGVVSEPIAIPGGYSILALEDTRQVLTADPRDAVLSLKQLSIGFAQGTPRDAIEAKLQELIRTSQSMGGCSGAEAAAQRIGEIGRAHV